jgi:hypothetical protein
VALQTEVRTGTSGAGAVTEGEGGRGISARAILLGLVLVAGTCLLVSYAELVIQGIQIGFLQMPPAIVGILLFIVVLRLGLRKLGGFFGLNPSEILVIYCMILVAAMISSRGLMEKVLPLFVTTNYYANKANEWHELYDPHLKPWMVAYDPTKPGIQPVSRGYFEGLWEGEEIPWRLWATPLAAWSALVLLVFFAFLCMASILRRQWVENERLSFPLVQLPVEMVRPDGPQHLMRNRLLWGGAALPAVVFTLNGLHNMAPSVPQIPLSIFLNTYLVTPPWDAIYWWGIFFSFAAVGFFFLLPTEVLFSLWFFALFARFQDVVAGSFGMDIRRMPVYGTHLYVAYQTVGAYFVLAAYLLWAARPHLKRVVASAFGRERVDDSREMLPYPVAFWGLFGSLALIVLWTWKAGLSPAVALLEFGVCLFVVALVLARSTAEAGVLMTETSFRPVDVYRMFAPMSSLGAQNLALLPFFDTVFLREQRGLLLTGFLDGLKISDSIQTRRRNMLAVFGLGILAAMLIAGAYHIWLPYNKGGINLYQYVYQGHAYWTLSEYEAQMRDAAPATREGLFWFMVGAAFTVFLSYMRSAFFWWPFHPLGYALCVSWTMSVFWFSCLVAWIIKVFILRYGGMRLFLKARPWFLGMVLGEFGMAVIWAIISGITGARAPEFPWP